MIKKLTNEIYNCLGWLFCEAAFRMWNILPTWWDDPLNRVMPGPLYRLGCWFYERATRVAPGL